MASMTISLPLLFLHFMSFYALARDSVCQGTQCDVVAAWADAGEQLQGLEMLQVSSAKAHAASKHKDCSLPPGARWCTATSGDKSWKMAVYSEKADRWLSSAICSQGFWEFRHPTGMGIKENASEGMVLLDIGANIGWYTFMFAAHGHRVIAVEPMTSNRDLMHATLCQNPELKNNVHILAAALTDSAKRGQTCSILSAKTNSGDGILACSDSEIKKIRETAEEPHFVREKVPLTTFDALIKEQPDVIGDRIDVVKIDVEGQECNVLAGSSKTISRFQPKYFMVEARLWKQYPTFDCIVSNVSSHGSYRMHLNTFQGQNLTFAGAKANLSGTKDIFFTS